eukprot:SAG31_NODE_3775_length_3896_cov_2.532666_2_plen_279_part_00
MLSQTDSSKSKESASLVYGDEIAVQVSDTTDDGSVLVGYIGIKAGNASIDVEYMHGDPKQAPRPPEPNNCRFILEPPVSSRKAGGHRDGKAKHSDGASKERAETDLKRLAGMPILYGQQLSLRHASTQQLVVFCLSGVDVPHSETVSSKEHHAEMLTSTKMAVTRSVADDTMTAIMMILPAFKMRTIGERVRRSDTIVLRRVMVGKLDRAPCFMFVRPHVAPKPSSTTAIDPCVVSEQAVVGSEVDKSRMQIIPIAKSALAVSIFSRDDSTFDAFLLC